ncbi:hypothetical protein JIX56_33410 [Streptomyces sp. CA-210063]|uniref:hypothetical protein n=1 Tax=Streptomyces sp. CA-210063 TaxID=2801029 RepID=UPI00214C7CDF|nr:hypothetical protein [Streptomyces sp. CA-210063]UUU34347.1 hypothetical protein JIX56_33410 [Streptomyces sp. CA-210063]
MSGMRLMVAALVVAVGLICALVIAFWRLARTKNVDQALMTGGGVFVAAFTVAFMVMTYVHPD